jgi:predicted ATPase
LISAVTILPKQRLDDALAQLVTAELIYRRGTPPDAEYTFKHALVQDAAYSTLLHSRRQQLHARIVTILEAEFPEIVAAQPELMAHHSAEAGFNDKAIDYCLKAGQQAIARSAMMEAVARFQKGSDLLSSLPDNARRWQWELDLQLALGQALVVTRGYSSPWVWRDCRSFARISRAVGSPGPTRPGALWPMDVPPRPSGAQAGRITC